MRSTRREMGSSSSSTVPHTPLRQPSRRSVRSLPIPGQRAGGYVGLDVHRAARICSAGHGGPILLSQTTRALVEHDLPEGTSLRDLGTHRLKDLQRPERLFQLVIPDLPADFPPLKTLDSRPNNLPAQPTALIGRERETAAVCDLLQRQAVRLLTLSALGVPAKPAWACKGRRT